MVSRILAPLAVAGMVAIPASVIAAPPPRPAYSASPSASFSAAYRRAGSPRVIVFWNREFSDEVASRYTDVVRGHSESRSGVSGGESYRTDDLAVSAGTERGDDSRRESDFTERADWKLESAFLSGLAGNGVALVDRNTVMRKAGRGAALMPNQQSIETDALVGFADILIEVLQTSDDAAPLGTSFRISVKRIRDGRLISQFVSDGQVPMGRRPFVAGPNGYERAAPVPPSPSMVARKLADETLGALASGLSR
jgi:hypothetical protein